MSKKIESVHSVNLDASSSIFFANQLNYIQTRVYEFEYPALKAFELIPVSYDTPEGAEYTTYTAYQAAGRARVIESYADDLPAADLIGANLMQKIVSIGASYRYSHQEIRAAQLARINLPALQAEAARRAIDQTMNQLAFFGNSATGTTGFLNNPFVPSAPVPADGTGGNTEWTTKTPDQILRDLNLLVNAIVTNSNGVEMPNTVLLPLEQYTLIASTPRSSTSDTTILNYFLLNNPYVTRVESLIQLNGAGPAGVDIGVAYDRSNSKLVMEMPMGFTQYAPQERNLEFVINCEARFGGVNIFYPLSMNIIEGI